MRRNAADILFVYHYTHRVRRPFLPSVSSSSPSPFSSLSPAPLIGPFLVSRFPRSLVHPSFLSPSLSLSTIRFPSRRRVYLFYFIIKQTPLPVILAPTCVFTRTHGDPCQTQSPLDARIGLRDRSRDEKYFFPLLILGITPSSRVSPSPPALSERLRLALIATLKGIFHLKGILYAFETHLKTRVQKRSCNKCSTQTCMQYVIYKKFIRR